MRPINRFAFLTERERIVLAHLMRGRCAEEIARADYVSPHTVRSQIRSILMKLGVNSQLAAVAMAYRAMLDHEVERAIAAIGGEHEQERSHVVAG